MVVYTNQLRRKIWDMMWERGYFHGKNPAKHLEKCTGGFIPESSARELINQFRKNFHWKKEHAQRKRRSDTAPAWLRETIKRILLSNPAAYMDEIQAEIKRDTDIERISLPTICSIIYAKVEDGGLGMSHKVLTRYARQASMRERSSYLELLEARKLEPR